MFLKDNPCQCGDRRCDAAWIIEEGLGIRNRQMGTDDVGVALSAIASAVASVLAAIDPPHEERWFDHVRKTIKDRRVQQSN